MDALGNVFSGQNKALVVLAFLQTDCRNSEFSKELQFLRKDPSLYRDINSNEPESWRESLDDGNLETDGHLPSNAFLGDIQPSVDLQWPRNNVDVGVIQDVAMMLRDIAEQFEQNLVARETENLCRDISKSNSAQWKGHLSRAVKSVMAQGVGLEQLPQERLILALTLTLVKGVCEQTPWVLRNLFSTALQFINTQWTS